MRLSTHFAEVRSASFVGEVLLTTPNHRVAAPLPVTVKLRRFEIPRFACANFAAVTNVAVLLLLLHLVPVLTNSLLNLWSVRASKTIGRMKGIFLNQLRVGRAPATKRGAIAPEHLEMFGARTGNRAPSMELN